MERGEGRLTLEVVPGSGGRQLEGLVRTMKINIEDGKHLYEFEYALAVRD